MYEAKKKKRTNLSFHIIATLRKHNGGDTATKQKVLIRSKNNRSASAFYILVHFFAVLCKTTTGNYQIRGFVENVNTRRRILFFSLFFNLKATPISSVPGDVFVSVAVLYS